MQRSNSLIVLPNSKTSTDHRMHALLKQELRRALVESAAQLNRAKSEAGTLRPWKYFGAMYEEHGRTTRAAYDRFAARMKVRFNLFLLP